MTGRDDLTHSIENALIGRVLTLTLDKSHRLTLIKRSLTNTLFGALYSQEYKMVSRILGIPRRIQALISMYVITISLLYISLLILALFNIFVSLNSDSFDFSNRIVKIINLVFVTVFLISLLFRLTENITSSRIIKYGSLESNIELLEKTVDAEARIKVDSGFLHPDKQEAALQNTFNLTSIMSEGTFLDKSFDKQSYIENMINTVGNTDEMTEISLAKARRAWEIFDPYGYLEVSDGSQYQPKAEKQG